MNMALRLLNQEPYAVAPRADAAVARVEVFDDFAAAEPHWRALEAGNALATPYQSFDFIRLWHRHIGADAGLSPFLVVGFNARGELLFLWPLGRRPLNGMQAIEFLGGKHINFNIGLWRRDVAARIDADGLRDILGLLRDKADIVMLANQPATWAGLANPFALLPNQPSPSFGYSGALMPDFEALYQSRASSSARKKMRRKERLLADAGAVRFNKTEGAADIRAVLADFYEQKTARTRAIGLPDVFSDAGVRRFLEAAAEAPARDGHSLLELYTLTIDDVIVATIGGIVGDGRFSAMFISIVHERFAAESPGQQLLIHMVRHCCERGLTVFDLGIGEAKYKDLFCPEAEAMFDSYWPLTAAGNLTAHVFRRVAAAKRFIKQQPALWSMVTAMRRLRARLSR